MYAEMLHNLYSSLHDIGVNKSWRMRCACNTYGKISNAKRKKEFSRNNIGYKTTSIIVYIINTDLEEV
jgi:hypothetical protein